MQSISPTLFDSWHREQEVNPFSIRASVIAINFKIASRITRLHPEIRNRSPILGEAFQHIEEQLDEGISAEIHPGYVQALVIEFSSGKTRELWSKIDWPVITQAACLGYFETLRRLEQAGFPPPEHLEVKPVSGYKQEREAKHAEATRDTDDRTNENGHHFSPRELAMSNLCLGSAL